MNENANYSVISTNPDSKSITNALDSMGRLGFLVAAPTMTLGQFEVLMYRTEGNSDHFQEFGEPMTSYNYECGKVENLKNSIENYLNSMGEQGWKIANSWVEGNFIGFIMYKEIIDEADQPEVSNL